MNAHVLQQSMIAGKTQLLIDMSPQAEYDYVDLELDTENFVAHALVEGQNDPHGQRWASLGDSILFDLSNENLGRNFRLRLPRTSYYKYLRVTIDGAVDPEDVRRDATSGMRYEPVLWRNVSSAPKQEQKDKDTIVTFDAPENAPIDRVMFVVDPTQPNFLRKVEIHDEKGRWLGSGEIDCIHMVRGGLKIGSDHRNVDFWDKNNGWQGFKFIKVVIHNGDDPPLKLTDARLQQLERRLYFDAPTAGQPTLYYGDNELQGPAYAYANLLQPDKGAAAAQLGPETSNAAYTGRPDDRPWSERHPVVLWIAIIAAMAVLGGVAFRFLRTATATFIVEKLPLLLRAAVISVPLAVGTEVLLLLLRVPTPGVILGDLLFPGQPRAAPVVDPEALLVMIIVDSTCWFIVLIMAPRVIARWKRTKGTPKSVFRVLAAVASVPLAVGTEVLLLLLLGKKVATPGATISYLLYPDQFLRSAFDISVIVMIAIDSICWFIILIVVPRLISRWKRKKGNPLVKKSDAE